LLSRVGEQFAKLAGIDVIELDPHRGEPLAPPHLDAYRRRPLNGGEDASFVEHHACSVEVIG
jgi:hypothetical protein